MHFWIKFKDLKTTDHHQIVHRYTHSRLRNILFFNSYIGKILRKVAHIGIWFRLTKIKQFIVFYIIYKFIIIVTEIKETFIIYIHKNDVTYVCSLYSILKNYLIDFDENFKNYPKIDTSKTELRYSGNTPIYHRIL